MQRQQLRQLLRQQQLTSPRVVPQLLPPRLQHYLVLASHQVKRTVKPLIDCILSLALLKQVLVNLAMD